LVDFVIRQQQDFIDQNQTLKKRKIINTKKLLISEKNKMTIRRTNTLENGVKDTHRQASPLSAIIVTA